MAISVGGDTDTNACVVCGLVGALVGFHAIPEQMMGKVLSFDCTKEIINREKFLSTKYHSASLIN
jgi:ADP-ribosylglycohydrolase